MDGSHKAAIEIIQNYILEFAPRHLALHSESVAQTSYYCWAANEVLQAIKDCPTIPPLLVIEKLWYKMGKYSLMNKESSYLFSVAYDAVTDILDLFV